MSFYTLALYFWCAVALVGLALPLLAAAALIAADTASKWAQALENDDEPIVSSAQPLSCP